MDSRLGAAARSVGRFYIQCVLCGLVWWIADACGFNSNEGFFFGFLALLLGLFAVGCAARVFRGRRVEAYAAAWLVSFAVWTEFFRVYVLDYFGRRPTYCEALRDTFVMNLPYVTVLALVPLAGWSVAALALRRP